MISPILARRRLLLPTSSTLPLVRAQTKSQDSLQATEQTSLGVSGPQAPLQILIADRVWKLVVVWFEVDDNGLLSCLANEQNLLAAYGGKPASVAW